MRKLTKRKGSEQEMVGEPRRRASRDAPVEIFREIKRAAESRVDPLGMATPLLHAQLAWLSHPQELADQLSSLSTKLWALNLHFLRRMTGAPSEDVQRPHPDDMRFADPVWTETATWDIVKESYLALTHHIQDMLYNTPGMSARDRRRAAFWWRKMLNAVAPTNFLWTNPVAMRKAVESHGRSLARGMQILLDDLRAGDIRMTRAQDFRVGVNLATTPGKVILRNRLLEVIHYAPVREQVAAMPIVIVTPWINKFYVLDLEPEKSMVRYLLDQGFDVYITSWKNPDASMRDVGFDDYLSQGIACAIDAARDISGAAKVHAVGYCIGGAALATYAAWANRRYRADDVPLASLSLFATLVDYHKPGDIEVFLDGTSYRWLADSMARKGFLDGKEMAAAFRLLRSNSLIWHYVVHGYLYGETPPPFDVLFWNMDTTRMPAAMHTWYLREFYLRNKLIEPDAITLCGQPIDLGRIIQPLYAVAARDDHIAPWRQAFHINRHVAGPRRFVLSSSGHILGIVNPVRTPAKREYWAADAAGRKSAAEWLGHATHEQGSWWPDWAGWLRQLSPAARPAPGVANQRYPAIADAPGAYVLEP